MFLAALLGLASVSTFAGGNGCHNGCGGPGNSTNNNKAIGGQGGAGGHGGSVLGSGNSANHNSNSNTNTLGQMQGQLQGQAQGQGQSQVANGGSASSSAVIGNTTNNSGGNTMTGGDQANSQSTTITHEAQARNPVNTAYAAPLTTSNGTCMGSTSAGGQGVTFGVSFGTTWTDDNCDRRFDAIELRAQGLTLAATALMCQKENIRKAMKTAGTPCPEDNGQGNAAAGAPQAQVAQLPAAGNTAASSSANDHPAQSYSGNDPFVLARLGIVPLDSQR